MIEPEAYTSSLSAFAEKGGILGLIIFVLFIFLFLERNITSYRQGKHVKDILAAINELRVDFYKSGILDRRKQNVPVKQDRRNNERL